MAGQRPLADDHTWTGWQPRTHATFNISTCMMQTKQIRPAATTYFQYACAQGTPKWASSLSDLSLAEYHMALMAGQRPLADDHTCTCWQPLAHATSNISTCLMQTKQVRPAATTYFQ